MTAEQNVGGLALMGFAAFAACRLYLRLREKMPKSIPDPWGPEVETAMQQDDAMPVCHRCFTTQDASARFCKKCGTSVGPYNNWMPYIHVFSEGEVLRAGTGGRFQINIVTITCYILYSFSLYFILAPVYWFLLFKNINRIRRLPDEENISNRPSANYDSGQIE